MVHSFVIGQVSLTSLSGPVYAQHFRPEAPGSPEPDGCDLDDVEKCRLGQLDEDQPDAPEPRLNRLRELL